MTEDPEVRDPEKDEPEPGVALARAVQVSPGAVEALGTAMESLGMPTPAEWAAMRGMAEQLSRSHLVPGPLRGEPDDVMVILLTARDLRIAPTAAMGKIHVLDGKPTLSAEMMCALVLRAGFEIWPDPTNDDSKATALGVRNGHDMAFTFTLQNAVQAGLCQLKDGKAFARDSKGRAKPWEAYTQSMLWARAVSGLCRQAFSDVLMGVSYTPEEMGASVDGDGNLIEITDPDAYRPASWQPQGGRQLSPDEESQMRGWANAEQWTTCRNWMRDLAALLGPEVSQRVKNWRTSNRIDMATPDGWLRTVGAALYFAEHDGFAPPPPSPPRTETATRPVTDTAPPADSGGPHRVLHADSAAMESLGRSRLAAAGVTAELLASPTRSRTPEQEALIARAMRTEDGPVLLRWMTETIAAKPPHLPDEPTPREPPVTEQPTLAVDVTDDDRTAVASASSDIVDDVIASVAGLKPQTVDRMLADLALITTGGLDDRRRRLSLRLIADRVRQEVHPDAIETTAVESTNEQQ
jgi:hypothetical protein